MMDGSAEHRSCPKCAARRLVQWIVQPFIGLLICPFCDNVEVWGSGFEMSMSVSAWIVWAEETISLTVAGDDPPPPGIPKDTLDRRIQWMIDEARREQG